MPPTNPFKVFVSLMDYLPCLSDAGFSAGSRSFVPFLRLSPVLIAPAAAAENLFLLATI
jgi:hypothetical protein